MYGSRENEKSFVWSIGISIDQLFTRKLYYNKVEDVTDGKGKWLVDLEDYKYRGAAETKDIGDILARMIVKNK